MLRAAAPRLSRARPVSSQVSKTLQWQPRTRAQVCMSQAPIRWFADTKGPDNVNPSPPGSIPPTKRPSSEIAPESVPRTPPSPPSASKSETSKPASSSPAPPGPSQFDSSPPPPPTGRPKKPRRLTRLIVYLTLFLGTSYGAGVYYSLISDNFHDFFTEYVPFGEESVLYFEERQYKHRLSTLPTSKGDQQSRDTGKSVTIPSRSGISWKIAEGSEKGKNGSSTSKAPTENTGQQGPKSGAGEARLHPADATGEEKVKAVESAKKDGSPTGSAKDSSKQQSSNAKNTGTRSKRPEEKEESKAAPLKAIDPISIQDAQEPVVQDLVKLLNNVIAAVNVDDASGKFSSVIQSAKSELFTVGKRIDDLKKAEQESAESKIKSTHEEFDKAAKYLVRRLEGELRDQEHQWREEFETERNKITGSYQEKLKTELVKANEVSDQKLRNQLLEQAIEMKRHFISTVHDRVETERNSRLGKLSGLSASVAELGKLTADWNSVVDANLQTQHLQVAVEAVRAQLDDVETPRPFLRELAALKEVASENGVVKAAIGSIDPVSYQHGVPSAGLIVDRFRQVSQEVRKASLLPDEAGVASHAASYLLSKLMFRKQGLGRGDDVESVLTRTEMLLEEGDFDGAAREMNGLHGWAKTLSKDWLGEVRRVLELRQAMDVRAQQK